MRHPLYLAVLLLTGGLSLAAANWFFLLTGVAIFGVIAVRTRIEERNLIVRFGDDYRRYMSTTGRFFPKLH